MFKKKLSITGVNQGYKTQKGILFYQAGKHLIKYDLINQVELIRSEISDSFQGVFSIQEFLIAISNSGYSLFDYNLKEVKHIEVENGIGDFCLYGSLLKTTSDYDYSSFSSKFGVQDVFTDEVIWEANFGETLHIRSGFVFTISPSEVSRRRLFDGKVLWTTSMSSDITVPKLIGVSKGLAIFYFGEDLKIMALNMDDGTVKWQIDTLPKGLCVDERHGMLHQLMVNYASFDLNRGILVDRFQNPNYFQSVQIESQRDNYVMLGRNIVTTDWKRGVIGLFNTRNHKFDWVHHEEGESFPSSTSVTYHDPYLLVLGRNSTLHIFEHH